MERFEEFITERVYLIGVSKKTVDYYRWAFNSWKRHAPSGDPKEWVVNVRKAGASPISVNTYICALNTYWKWSGEGKHLDYLKEEQKILATLSANHVTSLLRYKAVGTNLLRAHMVALTILDTGLRASEVLGLTKEAIDYDNLIIRVIGKGNKHRLIPFSSELRKSLWRYQGRTPAKYIFGTKNNTKVTVRNLERDFHVLGEKLGITGVRFSPHTLRHTLAVSYLRNGGNLEFLRRILGHSSLVTTQKYLRSLGVEDLGAVHSSLSPLARR
jgi:integrase/recombinase XerD